MNALADEGPHLNTLHTSLGDGRQVEGRKGITIIFADLSPAAIKLQPDRQLRQAISATRFAQLARNKRSQ